MAKELVKWWKTKVLKGYKKITVIPDYGATDTEELICQRAPSACSAPPDLLPRGEALGGTDSPVRERRAPASCGNTPDRTVDPDNRVTFGDLKLNVSVLEGGSADSALPVQFSMTVYDLGGHGRITKDDINAIGSKIYEYFNKGGVVVPHHGSKKIDITLTVADEDKPSIASPSDPATPKDPPFTRRKPRRRRVAQPEYSDPHTDEDRCSPAGDDDLSDSDPPRPTRRTRHYKSRSRRENNHPLEKTEIRGRSLSVGGGQRSCWRRSGSLQRKELLEIIQASMEKNNLCFQTNRKSNNDEMPSRRHRHRSHTVTRTPEHQDTKFCRYDSFLHSVLCSQSVNHHSQSSGGQNNQNNHHQIPPAKVPQRSRSHELNQTHPAIRYTLLEPSDISQCKFDPRKPLLKKHIPHACSPHHMKHHNREKYHARAMAQVEKWLEKDNSIRFAGRMKKINNNCNVNVDPVDSQECEGLLKTTDKLNDSLEDKPSSPTSPPVRTYVHEHIHHHYHHFEEDSASTAAI